MILFRSSTVSIGRFRCGPASSLWRSENLTGEHPIVVFPRTAVEIHQADRFSVVATPNQAMLYNSRQPYRRDLIDPRGDVCEFFAISPELADHALGIIGAPSSANANQPFQFSHTPCPSDVYLGQRNLFQIAEQGMVSDPLMVEEVFFSYLPRLMDQAFQLHDPFLRRKKPVRSDKWDQVEGVKDFIARRFRSKLSIQEISDYIEVSPFHLCRTFKRLTGQSIHQFLTQYRIRCAVEPILEDDRPLTEIALEFNFSSHSHFTNTFRQQFGISPSRVRKSDPHQLCKMLHETN